MCRGCFPDPGLVLGHAHLADFYMVHFKYSRVKKLMRQQLMRTPKLKVGSTWHFQFYHSPQSPGPWFPICKTG